MGLKGAPAGADKGGPRGGGSERTDVGGRLGVGDEQHALRELESLHEFDDCSNMAEKGFLQDLRAARWRLPPRGWVRACIHGETEAVYQVGALAFTLHGVDGGNGTKVDWTHRMHHAQVLVIVVAMLRVQLRSRAGS